MIKNIVRKWRRKVIFTPQTERKDQYEGIIRSDGKK